MTLVSVVQISIVCSKFNNFFPLVLECDFSALFLLCKVLTKPLRYWFSPLVANVLFRQWARFNILRSTLFTLEVNLRSKLLNFALRKISQYALFLSAKKCVKEAVNVLMPTVMTNSIGMDFLVLQDFNEEKEVSTERNSKIFQTLVLSKEKSPVNEPTSVVLKSNPRVRVTSGRIRAVRNEQSAIEKEIENGVKLGTTKVKYWKQDR